jgi:hypothetical protein
MILIKNILYNYRKNICMTLNLCVFNSVKKILILLIRIVH